MHSLFPSWAIEAQKEAAAAAAQRMRERKKCPNLVSLQPPRKMAKQEQGLEKNKNATTMLVRFFLERKCDKKYGKN